MFANLEGGTLYNSGIKCKWDPEISPSQGCLRSDTRDRWSPNGDVCTGIVFLWGRDNRSFTHHYAMLQWPSGYSQYHRQALSTSGQNRSAQAWLHGLLWAMKWEHKWWRGSFKNQLCAFLSLLGWPTIVLMGWPHHPGSHGENSMERSPRGLNVDGHTVWGNSDYHLPLRCATQHHVPSWHVRS